MRDDAAPSSAFMGGLGVAYLAAFIAMAPLLGMLVPLRAEAIDAAAKETLLSTALFWGAITAAVANVAAGVLSDRTRSRLGRRRPWMAGGVAGVLAAYAVIATATTGAALTAGVVLFQIGFNALLAALLALFADRTPAAARGRLSAAMGVSYPLGNMVGAALVGGWLTQDGARYGALAAILVVGVLPFVFRMREDGARDGEAPVEATPGSVTAWFGPFAHRDFVLVWLGRSAMTTGFVVGNVYLLYYIAADTNFQARYAASPEAGLALLTGVSFGAVLGVSLVLGLAGGRLRRRRGAAVTGAAVLAMSGGLLAMASDWPWVVAAFAVHGLGTGIYYAVETGLMVDALPPRDQRGGDLGLINLAAALPQAWAPLMALAALDLVQAGYRPVLWLSAAAFAMGAILFAALKRN
ncbi:MAG: MFS transporter [Brevundimonas sp.]|uniref:MFS transporter n=1 Tax=Brevundimonas sp. TaxID=1871086 RepID=UPI0025857A4D|nr:MFS transporter [Brevundimonas sp.]MCV0415084.1 MFS transporter [Brevundimonas sp.]